MGFELSLTINNQGIEDYRSIVRLVDDYPTFNWSFDLVDRVSIDVDTGVPTATGASSQSGYEIRISSSSVNVGTDIFIGNRVQTGLVASQEFFWRYSGVMIERGIRYYGQVRIVDDTNRESEWATFSFLYNSLPFITGLSITPSIPSVTDNLQLNYNFDDDDGDIEDGTRIRWFKNGEYQKQFDDTTIINSSFLQNDDIWNADVYPCDGYEFGSRVTSPFVQITQTAVTVSNLNILPKNPNPNDILKADYLASDEKEQENVLIRWYVNNVLIIALNDEQHVRPSLQEGDLVRFEVKHPSTGYYVSSSTATVVASDFVVTNILIDGKKEPLDVSSVTPLVQWSSYIPDNKEINYVSIKIGTFYEADNVYSTTISYSRDSFTIPANLLEKGRDYYISVALSDTQVFDKYAFAHFKINGSRWEKDVSNSTGWTLEMLLVVKSTTTDYQVIKVNDGSRFAEIRLYKDKLVLISGSKIEYAATLTEASILTIAGKNNDIKIYLNRDLVIDGEGIFTQESNIKRLEVGAYLSSDFTIHYKYFFYTTSGYFLPGSSSEYANLQFHTYMEFEDNEVVALTSYLNGKYVFGLNPDNLGESSTIYAITPGKAVATNTVPRTFAPINRISKSPNEKNIVCAHSKGVTIITGYLINSFDHELIFVDANDNLDATLPNNNGWELISNTNFEAVFFDENGLNINTLG